MKSIDLAVFTNWLGTGSINIFGLPLSGKDTQARHIASAIGGEVVAGGDILRAYHDQAKIKDLMATGKLFPSDFYFSVILPYLEQEKLTNKPLVLSSLGRWHGEEETILKVAAETGHPLKVVIFLEVDEAEIRSRFEASERKLARGQRHDDDERVLDVRITEFKNKTLPVIEFYKQRNLLITVNGNAGPAAVTEQIMASLIKLSKSS